MFFHPPSKDLLYKIDDIREEILNYLTKGGSPVSGETLLVVQSILDQYQRIYMS
jgi:hypothetical protein